MNWGDPEDFEQAEAMRQAAENMTGWNGSLTRWVSEQHQAVKPSKGTREALARIRDRAAASYQRNRAQGISV